MTSVEVKASPEGVPGAVTDPSTLTGKEITYPGFQGDDVNGYLVRPRTPPGSLPGLVLIHEAGGLGDHIRDVANRLANIGHVVLAVDLYTREGGPPERNMEAILARLFSMSDATVLGDLEGAAELLHAREDVTGRVGCIGFCMGGRYTLLFACSTDKLDAALDCWGGFVDRATPEEVFTPERPTPPLELVEAGLRCPLYIAIGAEDTNPSPELGAELARRVEASGQDVELEIFAGAAHAFFADYRPSYRPGPAAALWEQVVPFLARHLGQS
jgi:carboxymethylenebutenolidase